MNGMCRKWGRRPDALEGDAKSILLHLGEPGREKKYAFPPRRLLAMRQCDTVDRASMTWWISLLTTTLNVPSFHQSKWFTPMVPLFASGKNVAQIPEHGQDQVFVAGVLCGLSPMWCALRWVWAVALQWRDTPPSLAANQRGLSAGG